MELGYRAEIVSQTVPVVERKEGGIERRSQIRRGSVTKEVSGASMKPCSWGVLSGKNLFSPEYLVPVIGEVYGLLGIKEADV